MKVKQRKIIPMAGANHHYHPAYPNAAEPRYFLEKVVDILLAAATCMGCITIFFFLITM